MNRYPMGVMPTGWYVVCFSDELVTGKMLTARYFEKELVIYRTETGKAMVIDAYCPHLGAHFNHGGSVVGETVQCPFHAFRFDTDGACVFTPYEKKLPPNVNTKPWQVREFNGLILVFFDALGRDPQWEVPNHSDEGWTTLRHHTYELTSTPQETSENSVDTGHLAVVHGYKGIKIKEEFYSEGPYIRTSYGIERDGPFLKRSETIAAQFDVHVHGLGYSFVDNVVPKFGLRLQQFVLSTPIDRERVHLRIALRIQHIEKPGRFSPILALFPKKWVTNLIHKKAMDGFMRDVSDDLPIWNNKAYIERPGLADGDGPIGKYRRWAKQFYPELPAEKLSIGIQN